MENITFLSLKTKFQLSKIIKLLKMSWSTMYSTAKARSSKTSTLENPDSFYDFLYKIFSKTFKSRTDRYNNNIYK